MCYYSILTFLPFYELNTQDLVSYLQLKMRIFMKLSMKEENTRYVR